MQPTAIHHVSVNVRDLDQALLFYTDVLGARLRSDRPDDLGIEGAWLDFGGQQLHLLVREPPAAVGQHFAVRVDALDAAITELRDLGIEVSDSSPVGSARQAFLKDPSGNTVELHEPASE